MISLSKITGHTITAMSCLEGPDGQPISGNYVASYTNISRSYLANIIQSLVRKDLVKTKRGYSGGLLLTRAPEEITLHEVVVAIEGPEWIAKCLLRLEGCDDNCPTHAFWKEEKSRIESELRSRKLIEITNLKYTARNLSKMAG